MSQIANLQSDMNFYFNKVLAAVEQDTCYARLAGYEQKILSATTKMSLYHTNANGAGADVYKAQFLDECSGAQCADAVDNLISSINGKPGVFGCDLMEILYNGDVNADFYVGWKDQVATKTAYILSLISNGVLAQSAYSGL